MKVFKIALLGAAALSAASVGARADNLSDLKSEIETLNARVASLETAPAIPAGYQMVSFSKVGDEHVISIVPTADVPAPTTEIKWSGKVSAGVMAAFDKGNFSADVWTSTRLKVVGKTATAVGEVGVSIGLRADNDTKGGINVGNPSLNTDGYYGWWKMTPNLTFSGGTQNPIQKGTLAKSGYSFDASCTCVEISSWGSVVNDPLGKNNLVSSSSSNNPSQITLSYADGPLGLAVSLEDSNNSGNDSALGGSAKASYKMDMVGFDLNGGYWGNASGPAAWGVSAGIGLNLSGVKLGASVGTGNTGNFKNSIDQTVASGYAIIALGDSASAELGVVHDFSSASYGNDSWAGATLFEGSLYYTPVKQLLLGVEGQYQSGGQYDGSYIANVVSQFKF